jgi:hypothetical protein
VIGALGVVTIGTTGLALASIFGDYSDPSLPQATVECRPTDCVSPTLESGLTTTPSGTPGQTGGGDAATPANPAAHPGTTPGSAGPSQTPGNPKNSGDPGTRRPGASNPPGEGGDPHRQTPPPGPGTPPPARPTAGPVTVAYSTRHAGYRTEGVYTVTNHGGATLPPWHLSFTLPRSGGLLGSLFGDRHGRTVSVDGGALAPGGHATVTFRIYRSSDVPTGCLLNGKVCVAG